jgi:hypothetical protein
MSYPRRLDASYYSGVAVPATNLASIEADELITEGV